MVCTCVTGPRDVVEVYLGESGVLSGAREGNFEPGFTIDNMQKDVTLAGGLARELGVRLLTGAITEQVLREAQLRGLGARARRPRSSPWRTWPGSRCGRRHEGMSRAGPAPTEGRGAGVRPPGGTRRG